MDELLFNVNPACGVPEVPKVDFKFVEDCVIPAPPPPIFDCFPPIPPPPEPPPLCPEISGNITVDTRLKARSGEGCITSSQSAAGVISVTKTPNCEFIIDVNIDIPIPQPPCPLITTKDPVVTVGYEGCVSSSSNTFTVTPKPTCDPNAPCEFEFELELVVPIPKPPCPVINVKTFTVETGYEECLTTQNKFVISSSSGNPACPDDPGQCSFDIELELAIPVPKPVCPIINVKTFNVESGYKECLTTTNKFTVTAKPTPPTCPDDPGQCEFDIELELAIPVPKPVCPIINVKTFNVESGYEGCLTTTNKFTVTAKPALPKCPDDPGQCEFDIELELAIPVPKPVCPKITAGAVNLIADYEGCSSQPNKIWINAVEQQAACPNAPPTCEFEINLDLFVPIPKPPCPVLSTRSEIEETLTPYLNFYKRDLSVPDPCGNSPGQCEFEFVIELGVPPPVCPQIWLDTGTQLLEILEVDEEPQFEFKVIKKPDPTSPPGRFKDCDWELKPELKLPKPCIPEFEAIPATIENGRILLTDNGTARKEITITRSSPCKYFIEEYLWIPKSAKVTKGTIIAEWSTDCNGKPELEVELEPVLAANGAVLEYKLNLDLRIPKFPKYVGGEIDLGAYGTGQINITNDCTNPMITGQVNLYTNDCAGATSPGGGGGTQALTMPLTAAADKNTKPVQEAEIRAHGYAGSGDKRRKINTEAIWSDPKFMKQFMIQLKKNKQLRDLIRDVVAADD